MLATLVIGLREGLEAALIVSIVAAFLKKNGRSDALKLVWIGVATAVAICLAGGILLQRFEASLPQRQQEMLECVVAVAAVIMVSYMILWMKSHSRGLKGTLESSAGGALASGSAMALVVMAFLAVFREGFETAVFLLAAFQSSVSPTAAVLGAVLGVAIAVLLGVLLYKGALKLDLSRFFRATGVVLVFVAAGLVMSALRAAHEAGWVTVGQQSAANLSWLAAPGTVQSSLLTGVLGIRADPTVIEVTAWLLYLVPMLVVVLWPPRRPLTRLAAGRLLTGAGLVGLVVAGVLAWTAPAAPAPVSGPQSLAVSAVTVSATNADAGGGAGTSSTRAGGTAVVTLSGAVAGVAPASGTPATVGSSDASVTISVGSVIRTVTTSLTVTGHTDVHGLSAVTYEGAPSSVAVDPTAEGLPATLTGTQLSGSGRLPIGLRASDADIAMPATYTDTVRTTLSIDPATRTVLDVRVQVIRNVSVTTPRGITIAGGTVGRSTITATEAAIAAQTHAVRAAADDAVAHATRGQALPALFVLFALVMFGFGVPKLFRRKVYAPAGDTPQPAGTVQPIGPGQSNGPPEPAEIAQPPGLSRPHVPAGYADGPAVQPPLASTTRR